MEGMEPRFRASLSPSDLESPVKPSQTPQAYALALSRETGASRGPRPRPLLLERCRGGAAGSAADAVLRARRCPASHRLHNKATKRKSFSVRAPACQGHWSR